MWSIVIALVIVDLVIGIFGKKNIFSLDGFFLNLRIFVFWYFIIIIIIVEKGELKLSYSNYIYKVKSVYLLKCIIYFNFI